jgi:aspartate/methionine/tyrosine aminotransferase
MITNSFVLNDNRCLLQVNGAKEVALELNSSKTFNMAWRVGMVLGNAKAIDAILKVKSNMDSGMFSNSKEQLLR